MNSAAEKFCPTCGSTDTKVRGELVSLDMASLCAHPWHDAPLADWQQDKAESGISFTAPAPPQAELTEAQKIAQAVAEGYPDVDQICAECKTAFKNYHHFIRCDSATCPMKDGKGTILEQMVAQLDAEESGVAASPVVAPPPQRAPLSKNAIAREFFDRGYSEITDSQRALIDARFAQLSLQVHKFASDARKTSESPSRIGVPERAKTSSGNSDDVVGPEALGTVEQAGSNSGVVAEGGTDALVERIAGRIAGNLVICSQRYSENWRKEAITEVVRQELAHAPRSVDSAAPTKRCPVCQHEFHIGSCVAGQCLCYRSAGPAPAVESQKCPCLLRGKDGTFEHGEIVAILRKGEHSFVACANHVDGYPDGYDGWKKSPIGAVESADVEAERGQFEIYIRAVAQKNPAGLADNFISAAWFGWLARASHTRSQNGI